ncbi:MAG: hypothetical protein WCT14_15735, partial [Treponemataceae bacterium]
MYATVNAVSRIDRKRLRTSAVISAILWAVFLPLLSLMRYEGLRDEPSMNPIYIELEAPAIPPAKPKAEVEKVEIAEKTTHAPTAASPSSRAESAAAVRPSPASEPGMAAPALRPDPSAPPVSPRRSVSSAQRGGGEPFAPLSEDALKAAAPSAPTPGSVETQTRSSAAKPTSTPAASGSAKGRGDAFDKSLRTASERLASAPSGSSGSTGGAGSSASGSSKTARADLDGGFDFGEGAKRQLLSPRRIKVPDRILAGLPEVVSTTVSFKIESGGTVFKSSIRFDPPLPEELGAYLRTAFSGWQFSFSDSDGQVV